jgi:hypothetical protein
MIHWGILWKIKRTFRTILVFNAKLASEPKVSSRSDVKRKEIKVEFGHKMFSIRPTKNAFGVSTRWISFTECLQFNRGGRYKSYEETTHFQTKCSRNKVKSFTD